MQKSNPLVSIIIAAYNEERYIKFCLDSIYSQTYKNIEVILVDDGSTDSTVQIAREFKNLKIINQTHLGPGAARNLGAKHAKGDILAFLDADMKYDKNYIKCLVNPIIAKNSVGSFNKEEYVANTNNIWSYCWTLNSDLPKGKRAPAKLPDRLPLFRAIKKSIFLSAGGFDENYGYFDDETLFKKIKKKAVSAPGSVSYHYNPETLGEVFNSARWIGRGEKYPKNLYSFLRFSPFNSLRLGIKKTLLSKRPEFLLFKLVHDFGMLSGVFFSKGKQK